MTIADLVAEEARRLATRTDLDVEEAELVLKTYGVNVAAAAEDEDWDG